MAGTLTISTLSDGTNSTSSTNCIQGSAKAWVNFNGTPTSGSATIRASYNVSSVTILANADFTINFTNAFTDANYSIVGSAGNNNGNLAAVCQPFALTPPTTTSCRIQTPYNNGNLGGVPSTCVAFFR